MRIRGEEIFWNRTPAEMYTKHSNRIRSEVFSDAAGSGLDLDFACFENMLLPVYLTWGKPAKQRWTESLSQTLIPLKFQNF